MPPTVISPSRKLPGRLLALTAAAVLLGCPAAIAQDLDAGKPAPKLFAETCTACHRSAKGLAKGRFSFTLYFYLQKHYASNSSSAWALASYLESVDGGKRAPTRAAAVAPARQSSDWSPRTSLRPPASIPNR